MKYDAGELHLLSNLLDACTELPETQRKAWLDGLTGEAARLLPALERMLLRHETGDLDEFLEIPPQFAEPEIGALPDGFKADQLIGPYHLLRPIGRGGMGEVWLATRSDGQLKRGVALKLPLLNVRRGVLVQRFERERDILSALIHPNIARLYDAGVADDAQPYMALEYVEGKVITEAANDRVLDAVERVRLLRQVMGAVQYAHANLVVHRDLKPGNVLVTADGQAKLLDFGIAKLVDDETGTHGDSELTRLSGRALTLRYAAPELISGGAVSTAVDIWALGVLLYELLTGRRPFGSDTDDGNSIEKQILNRDPAPPSHARTGAIAKVSRSLASDLDTITLKALKKHPTERYATVGAFADDLDRWLRGEPVLAQPDSDWYRARRFVGRHKIAVSAAVLASTALITVTSVAVVLGLQAREESARAVTARDFIINIFRRTDPNLSKGQEVGAKQLLIQGSKAVLESMDGQPMLQAELLRSIGFALYDMFDLPATDKVFAQAAQRFQQVDKPPEAAALTMDRAALRLAASWEVSVASDLLSQAAAMYPSHASDDEFMARYAIYRSYSAFLADDQRATQNWYLAAKAHATATFKDTHPRTVLAVRTLAILDGALNQPNDATQRLTILLQRLQADKTSLPSDKLATLVGLGVAETVVGRYRPAQAHYDAALTLCQTSLNAKGIDCLYNEWNRTRLLLLLGQDGLAMKAIPFLVPQPDWEGEFVTLLRVQTYEILAKNRQLNQHADIVEQVVEAGNASSTRPENRWGSLAALVAQARHELQEGRPRRAMVLSTQAQSLIAQRGVSNSPFTRSAQALHGICLYALGDHAAAIQHLDSLYASLQTALGPQHPSTLLLSLSRVRPLWAMQRQHEALALIDQALPTLREAMGEQTPTFVNILKLRDELTGAAPESLPSLRQFDIFM